MKNIILEVDEEVGSVYEKIPPEKKSLIDLVINNWLKTAISEIRKDDFLVLLKQIQQEARKNGLTEEILQQILAESDN